LASLDNICWIISETSHQGVIVDKGRSDVCDLSGGEFLFVQGEEVTRDEVVDDGITKELKTNRYSPMKYTFDIFSGISCF
jgi:hypothetical protein